MSKLFFPPRHTNGLFLDSYNLANDNNLSHKEKLEGILKLNQDQKGCDFLYHIDYGLNNLYKLNAELFIYMNETRQKRVLRNLKQTYLLILAEIEYELTHQKTENLKKYNNQVKKCQENIDKLQYLLKCREKGQEPNPQYYILPENTPVAYLAIPAAETFAEQMVDICKGKIKSVKEIFDEIREDSCDRKTKYVKGSLDSVNDKRRYWSWTSAFLTTMLKLLPDDFGHTRHAKKVMTYPDPYTGNISYGLYLFKFTLEFCLLLKHTIPGPWMSEIEKNEGFYERFSTQMAQRKFALLNDLFWGIGNLLCFIWLVGKGPLGNIGNALTVALLTFDVLMASRAFFEEKTLYLQRIKDFEESIAKLQAQRLQIMDLMEERQKKIDALEEQITILGTIQDNENQRELLDQQLKELKAFQNQNQVVLDESENRINELNAEKVICTRDWDFKNRSLKITMLYALGLTIAFALLTGPFFPFAAGTLLGMTIAGAILCFAFSVIYNGIIGQIEVNKSKNLLEEIQDERQNKINYLLNILNNKEIDDNEKKLLFFEIKNLEADSKHQEKVVRLQMAHLFRKIIMDSAIPALIFVNFVIFPLAAPATFLIAVISASLGFYLGIEKTLKAEKEDYLPPDEEEYEEFRLNPDKWFMQSKPTLTKSVVSTSKTNFFSNENNLEIGGELQPLLKDSF